LRIPRNRVLRRLLYGLHDLQNPWSAALVLWPGKGPITLRLADSPRNETFVIPAGERRLFLRALARTVLGKDTSFVTARSETPGDPVDPANARGVGPPAWLPLLDYFLTGQYGWADCPPTIQLRVEGLVDDLRTSLGDNLVGIYLHGSLATGSFNPRWSDIDLLCVTRKPLDAGAKRPVLEAFLRHSRPPRGFEAMFVAEPRLRAWEYPTPFDFYFSEKLRSSFEADLRSGEWNTPDGQGGMSPFLASHVLVMRPRGVRLSGEHIDAVFPPIPEEDYVTSILLDFESKKARIPATTISGVLNACRCYSYLLEHRLDNKEEAAVWALRILPKKDRRIVRTVLGVYRGDRLQSQRFDEREVARFFDGMERRFDRLRARAT
jgi:predicted nucleotidyltransferase